MRTLNIDIEKATNKIHEEIHCVGDKILSRQMAEQLFNYHPDLFPVIEAWLEGDKLEFEFEGVSLAYIMEKERTNYISSLASMSLLLEGLDTPEKYLKRKIRQR